MVERGGPLSLSRQCGLLGVGRAALYREPAGESGANLALMRRIDEPYMECPFYGSRQMSRHLRREGVLAGRHRIRRLMRVMGLDKRRAVTTKALAISVRSRCSRTQRTTSSVEAAGIAESCRRHSGSLRTLPAPLARPLPKRQIDGAAALTVPLPPRREIRQFGPASSS